MRQLITILIVATLLLGCEEQRERVEKFVFDTKQITTRTIHNYELYPDGKIKADHSITYFSQAGIPFDSIGQYEQFTYNSAGNLESRFDPTDSGKRLYIYNEVDSLVGDFSINRFGDTIFLAITDYRNGKVVRRVNRMLSTTTPYDSDNMKMEDLRKYDTLLNISELVYSDDKLEKTISKDKDGNITSEVHELYEGGKPVKRMTYSILGDMKYVNEIVEYSDSYEGEPDYQVTNPQGDAVGYKKTVFQDNMRIVVYYMGMLGTQSISYYNHMGLLVGSVEIDLNEKTKEVFSFKHDAKGRVIEEANYKERLSNAR